jgi:hypothetical protein
MLTLKEFPVLFAYDLASYVRRHKLVFSENTLAG